LRALSIVSVILSLLRFNIMTRGYHGTMGS
jgi:hypothetical protein